jgi:hypothetical protein
METLKQLPTQTRNEIIFAELQKLYDYFGNKQEDSETLIRQVELLSEEMEVFTRLTADQFKDALKIGRRNANDVFKPSIKVIMQWVSNYLITIAKYEQRQEQEEVKIEITDQQRKAWIISAYRRYNELEKDMSKFFDAGGVIYNSLFNFYFDPLSEVQKKWCLNMAEKTKVFDIAQLLQKKQELNFETNFIAKSYGCKLIFDNYENETELRQTLAFDLPVDPDHSIAVYQYTKKN